MKRLFCTVMAVGLLCAGCTSGVSQEEYDAVVSERDALQEELSALKDLRNGEAGTQGANPGEGIRYDELRETLELLSAFPEDPNSANGVNFRVRFNYYDKARTAKYIIFYATAYNAVDDPVACEIRRKSSVVCRATGPFEGGKVYSQTYENAWYNPTIDYAIITKIVIEYTDGTVIACDSEIPVDRRDRPLKGDEVGKPL